MFLAGQRVPVHGGSMQNDRVLPLFVCLLIGALCLLWGWHFIFILACITVAVLIVWAVFPIRKAPHKPITWVHGKGWDSIK